MVTKAIDKCIFNKPAREGQLLKIYGRVGFIRCRFRKIKFSTH